MCSLLHSNPDPGEPHTGAEEVIQAGDWVEERRKKGGNLMSLTLLGMANLTS